MDYITESEMFDHAAEYYDRFRPGYPQQIMEALVQKAGLSSNSKMLEIGAGSGKATEQLLDYGFPIHCVEPGENLVQNGKLKFRFYPQISYECARFENLTTQDNQFDVIFSAQAFHWIPQPIGYQKCAEFLNENGSLALLWNLYLYDERQEHQELLELSRKYGGFADFISVSEVQRRIATDSMNIEQSCLFEKPTVIHIPWEKKYTLDEYFGFVQTGNRFIQLSEEKKESAYQELRLHFEKYGGTIVRPYLAVLYLSKVIK